MYESVRLLVLLVVSVFVWPGEASPHHDQTVHPGARGPGVVEAVCSRLEASCIFPEDKLFTRRLAYVESYDGLHPETYREGYHGGIWQVDKSMFEMTKDTANHPSLVQTLQDIRLVFRIDWTAVQWEDLTKPLHSALASRLYLQCATRDSGQAVPRSIKDQSAYWINFYRPQSDPQTFVQEVEGMELGCPNAPGADIIFLLDESSSVGQDNFEKIKSFVKDVIGSFGVGKGPQQNQFGVITYSSTVTREIDLADHHTHDGLRHAVDEIKYTGGSTYTHSALDVLVYQAFTEKNGARPKSQGHPRVGIVVTDGQSAVPSATVVSALRAQDSDITLFSVGVGGEVSLEELEVIASDPICLHVMLLNNFQEFESLKYIIEKRTCDAPIVIVPGDNSTIAGQLPAAGDKNCKIRVPEGGATIVMDSAGGHSTFYLSHSTYPSSEFYEDVMEATPGRLGVIYVPKPPTSDAEGTVFCNIRGDNNTHTNISVGGRPGDLDACRSGPCENGGSCVVTGKGKYRCRCPQGYTGDHCQTPSEGGGSEGCKGRPCVHGQCRATAGEGEMGGCVTVTGAIPVNSVNLDSTPALRGPVVRGGDV